MEMKPAIFAAAFAFILCASGRGNALTIDFEGLAPAGGSASPPSTVGDFDLTTIGFGISGSVLSQTVSDPSDVLPDHNSDWLRYNVTAALRITHSSGETFSIESFRATEWHISHFNNGGGGGLTFDVEGTLSGGGTINTQFTTDNDFDSFQTFTFDSSWTNLTQVEFIQPDGRLAYDDITVHAATAAVPEPSTLLLLGTGLAGLAGYRQRKRSAE